MDNRLEKIKAWLGSGSINLFGLPFSGKDTQGRQLATDLTGSLISSGDVLRHSQDNPEIQAIMKAGGIIPSQVFESIILPYLKRPEFAGKPIILSEVGRLLEEVPIITKASADSGHPLKAVIFLTLTDEAVWQRFDEANQIGDRGSRDDDNRKSIQTRLKMFHTNIEPVINYYREQAMLVEVDGLLSRQEVSDSIYGNLINIATKV